MGAESRDIGSVWWTGFLGSAVIVSLAWSRYPKTEEGDDSMDAASRGWMAILR